MNRWLAFCLVAACSGERFENRDSWDSRDSFEDVEADTRVDVEPDVDAWDSTPLPAAPGMALWVARWSQAGGPPVVEAFAGDQRIARRELSAVPAFTRLVWGEDGLVVREGDEVDTEVGSDAVFTPASPRLLAWAPEADDVEVRFGGSAVTFGPGLPDRARLSDGRDVVEVFAMSGAAQGEAPLMGLTLGDDVSARDDVRELVARELPVLLKAYHGSRPFLVRPGCGSSEACAPGGASYPCVAGCACECREAACDCDFSGLEDAMRARAIATATRWVGEGELSLVRVHYVFKRSLGGTSSCEANGEVAVDAETYGRFFAQAVEAATRINTEFGFPLIASLSPMNEANHPLQDGPQENGVGQGTAAGFLDFRAAIGQATGCAADRYIADSPDVLAMLAEAMVRGEAARVSVLSPEVALSLYLDVEQTDPFQTADDGGPAPVVTPLPRFLARLKDALAGRAFGDRELWVDTYPGSWAPPWSELGGARHVDPASGAIVRADPAFAAELAVARALASADDFEVAFGRDAQVVLGEVGWSTFDLDDEAQAVFLERLAEVSAATVLRDPRYRGWLWFKDTDREARRWPSWDVAEVPGLGVTLACNDSVLATWVCMIEVFERMEAAWGLFDHERQPKPAWARFVDAIGAR